MCCVVFAHLEPQNTRSPFSIEGTALAQITKYILKEGRVGSSRPLFLCCPRPPFTLTVIDELGRHAQHQTNSKLGITDKDSSPAWHQSELGPHKGDSDQKGNQL